MSIEKTYKPTNTPYQLDIVKDNYTDLQIIHPLILKYFEKDPKIDFGYVIVITFETNENEYIQRLKELSFFNDFLSFAGQDSAITFYLKCNNNIKFVEECALEILSKVYGYTESTIADVYIRTPR